MTRLTPRPTGFLLILGLAWGLLIAFAVGVIFRPGGEKIPLVALLVPLAAIAMLRSLRRGVHASADRLRVVGPRGSLDVPWSEVAGFELLPWTRGRHVVPEVLWVLLDDGQRHPAPQLRVSPDVMSAMIQKLEQLRVAGRDVG